MAKSFAADDFKGNRVEGTVVWESKDRTLLLVHEEQPGIGPALWLVDNLDEVGVALGAEELQEMLPQLTKWAQHNVTR